MSESDSENSQPIDYANPRHFSGSRVRWLTLVLAAVAVSLAIWCMTPGRMRQPAGAGGLSNLPMPKNQSNLRLLGMGMLLYCNDHQGEFPDSLSTLYANEDLSPADFVSPLSTDTPATGPTTRAVADQLMAGGHTSYIYLGRGLTDKKITPEMILAYESPADFVSGGTIVLFGDGHVEYQDKGFVAKMVRRPEMGLLPVTMPSTMPGN